MTIQKEITGGLYLVINPAPGLSEVLPRVESALRGGVSVLQIWNHWNEKDSPHDFIEAILALRNKFQVPVLVNNETDLLKETGLDGIHYDDPPVTPVELRARIDRPIIFGITCGNDLDKVRWAQEEGADYISFCSMFPSPSVSSCDIVSLETVRKARSIVSCPIFASGGITHENAVPVLESGADGLAVISGILKADNPEAAAGRYARIIRQTKGFPV